MKSAPGQRLADPTLYNGWQSRVLEVGSQLWISASLRSFAEVGIGQRPGGGAVEGAVLEGPVGTTWAGVKMAPIT